MINLPAENILTLKVIPESRDSLNVIWSYPGNEAVRIITKSELSDLEWQSKLISSKLKVGSLSAHDLVSLGELIGSSFIDLSDAHSIQGWLEGTDSRFKLCVIPDESIKWITNLLIETLILPGTHIPMSFLPRARGSLDFAHLHNATENDSGVSNFVKCLIVISDSPQYPLLSKIESKDILSRVLPRENLRFRILRNPTPEELKARIRLGCHIFLYMGHGILDTGSYKLLLGQKYVNAAELIEDFALSRTQVLIFDSCHSGNGTKDEGLPSILNFLPDVTCLLGMNGPALDIVSTLYMPLLVEKLAIGQSIWQCVSLLKILLFEQGSPFWYQPRLHLKPTYKVFQSHQKLDLHLKSIAQTLTKTTNND